jgi:hypothetical protein
MHEGVGRHLRIAGSFNTQVQSADTIVSLVRRYLSGSMARGSENRSPLRLGLTAETRSRSVRALNRLLAHAMALRDLYTKAHWQTSGAAFYGLHLMFDKHYEAQSSFLVRRVHWHARPRSMATMAPTTSS